MPFLDSLDIANRAIQLLGGTQIVSVTEDSTNNNEVAFVYDKIRRAELRRNVWRFSIRKAVLRAVDTTTRELSPAVYDATVTYLPGAIVKDANGQLWISSRHDNLSNTPGSTDVWDMYFGPLTVSLYDSTTSYFAGELVYVPSATAGLYQIYLSLQSDNSDVPGTATPWDATVTYPRDAVVSNTGSQWRSLLDVNINVRPADGPLNFDITATYTIAQTVTGSDHLIYSSIGNGNVGHDPTTDGGVNWTNTGVANGWSRTPTLLVSSIKWLPLANAVARSMVFLYPIGTGPASQMQTNNVFRLPAGYVKEAPQNPKPGIGALGGPTGTTYSDWNFEGDFIVSADCGAIVFRFAADVTKVSAMDDMFCEGLACRIATEVCEKITQSTTKLASIASAYKTSMGEARAANGIETGPVESPDDDLITVRW